MIISVGYRVKSKKGIIFRKWANQILKDYLLKGYTINNKRLEYLEKTIKLIDIASRVQSEESNDIIKIINKNMAKQEIKHEHELNVEEAVSRSEAFFNKRETRYIASTFRTDRAIAS